MKKIVIAAVLVMTAATSAQAFEMPNLWWPEEFTGKTKTEDTVQMIVDSKATQAYLQKKGMGPVSSVVKTSSNKYVVVSGTCAFEVIVRSNGDVKPVAGSFNCGE